MNDEDDKFFEQLEQNSAIINLDDTFEYINKLNEEKEGVLASAYPTINGVPIKIYRSGSSFRFYSQALSRIEPAIDASLYQSDLYGYTRKFFIVNNNELFSVEDGGSNTKIYFQRDLAEGEIFNIHNREDDKKYYYRSIQTINSHSKVPADYIASRAIKTASFFQYNGYLEFFVNDIKMSFFSCKVKGERFLIIDSLSEIDYDQFDIITEIVLECFALISGNLYRNERVILGAEDCNFKKIISFSFFNIDKSIISNHELFNYLELCEVLNINKTDKLLINVFENLVNIAFKDKRILRTIKLITQTYNTPIEARASSIFVALETVKNVILDQNEESVSLVKDTRIAKEMIERMKEIVYMVSINEFNNRDALLSKINSINKIGNNDGLRKIFDLYGIVLNKEDKDCIAARNRFLHGTVPGKIENRKEHERYIALITLRTQFLVSVLLLKMSGYNGYVKCSFSFLDKFIFDDKLNEPLFRKI